MALIQCPECNHTVSNQAASCPSCGFILNPQLVQPPVLPQHIYTVHRERDPDLKYITDRLKFRRALGITILIIIIVIFFFSQVH